METPTHTQQESTESDYYSATLTGPGFYLAIDLISPQHIKLFEQAVDIVRAEQTIAAQPAQA